MMMTMTARTHSTYKRISYSSNPLVGANVHRRAACEQRLVDDVCTQPVALYSDIASIPGSRQLVSDGLLVDEKDDRHQAVREVLQYVQWQPEHHREGDSHITDGSCYCRWMVMVCGCPQLTSA